MKQYNDFEYEAFKRQSRKQHKQFRDVRKAKKMLWNGKEEN